MNADSHLLAVGEVASRMHVHTSTVRRWIDKGELPAIRYGRVIRVDPADLGARTFEVPDGREHPTTGKNRHRTR